MVRKCRTCKAPKWASDPCSNANCATTRTLAPLKAKTLPVTATVTHGYHAGATTTTQLVSDYDMPISARSTWTRATV